MEQFDSTMVRSTRVYGASINWHMGTGMQGDNKVGASASVHGVQATQQSSTRLGIAVMLKVFDFLVTFL